MIIIKTQKEAEDLIENGRLIIDDSVTFECSIEIEAKIEAKGNINAKDIKAKDISANDIDAWDIKAKDISANDIKAWNIKAKDIKAKDIKAGNIDARDIKAGNIDARDIDARDIDAWDTKAWNINARDIDVKDIKAKAIDACDIVFFAVCVAYIKFKCKSIIGRRKNSNFFCLDSYVEIIENGYEENMKDDKVLDFSKKDKEFIYKTMVDRELRKLADAINDLRSLMSKSFEVIFESLTRRKDEVFKDPKTPYPLTNQEKKLKNKIIKKPRKRISK